jgi:tyrosine-protein phosphatase YwqE
MRRTAQGLLDRDMVSIIASDGHGAMRRAPVLMGAYTRLLQKQPEEWVNHLFIDNPKWVVGRVVG